MKTFTEFIKEQKAKSIDWMGEDKMDKYHISLTEAISLVEQWQKLNKHAVSSSGPDWEGLEDDEDDEGWERERIMERREAELAERAIDCSCGAWAFAKDGSVLHVADCCCGAE